MRLCGFPAKRLHGVAGFRCMSQKDFSKSQVSTASRRRLRNYLGNAMPFFGSGDWLNP